MMWLWLVFLWLPDSLPGTLYRWLGLSERAEGLCAAVSVQSTNRPLYFIWQEHAGGGSWMDIQRIRIDRWELPRDYRICCAQGQPGKKVRVVLRGLTAQSPQIVLYEGYPWGEPPAPSEISVETGKPCVLRVAVGSAGAYVLRAFNRFGEEVFTIPVEALSSQEFKYSLPETIRGALLVQLYSVSHRKVLAEKSFRL